jgi:Na+-transporting NADH:ubiquinone oxidoreductase subunit C
VYIFGKDGREITVIPCYGAGLWGPVWGYLAFADDAKTFVGAYFDHESETPGLGAKIKDDPDFRAQFVGKQADWASSPVFAIVKGGAAKASEIDAITSATMTSKGLGTAVNTWLEAYKPYFQKK